ncbi:hypothetical protein FPZ42_07035 [Mucilaginibacter achroorhodeus]|uniref:Uncharacterized protein n=1 Tax=Mucilaginibacter achroorhodeus TaxID=2599294 RepID=A0A563U627_9SPHI|nr:hypothetical protein [Mucilaginibacter achroorhodeus]TWR26785.1 hypothetical protein FPZ42_07035 [Mucilaginibacter achroorhodeus]
MDATIVDLKDFAVRTPEQAVRVFYRLYSSEAINAALLKVFMRVAGDRVPGDDEMELANLFDHLNALVKAVEDLRSGLSDAPNCVICGAKKGK